MNAFRGGLAFAGTCLVSLLLVTAASAAPLMIGDKQCGELQKTRTDGVATWRITGCQPLEDLVNAPAACNNGKVDGDEFCDQSATPNGCGANEVCNGCVECRFGTAPTPTPAPGATPTPPPVVGGNCPQGELPPLGSFPNERGIDSGIDNGATRTYCFTLTADTTSVDFNASDLTGAAQCFWATAFTVTPPLGSGLFPDTDFGRNPHLGYYRSGQLIPKGTYLVSVTSQGEASCAQRYRLNARWR